ncbi:cytochrome P450 [Aspergillus heteromorphus CBS 117.55]|uniref:Cytochrome P450 n=1 Tax=Aspergillus heteromorphus CBS 117.55 TaxID=1448321 RepID=A0A317VV32_9EURO|nr:cytochrome P450 [Aspergillus heteromorphus CBS 117.55]PWY78246.1 cytochrome P450 [Aspergillus heteromorphus CBS 117.55]
MAVVLELLESRHILQGVAVVLMLIILSNFYHELVKDLPYQEIHLVGKGRWEILSTKAKQRFVKSARELVAEGFSQGRKMFQIVSDANLTIVLHPSFVDEIKNHPHLDFKKFLRKSFFGSTVPGLEPFDGVDEHGIILEVINKNITQGLDKLISPLSRESAMVLREKLPESNEWVALAFAQEIPYMIARLSSLVFLGEKLCRDKQWLDVSVNYTIHAFFAARDLRLYPSILRPLVHWFLPSTRRAREDMRIAAGIVDHEMEQRKLIREGKISEKPPRTQEDTMDWVRQVACGRPIDATRVQVGFSMAAIHTTSNLLTNIMYDLTAYPEHIQPLRDEIAAVIHEDGVLKKSSLTKMKLLDSVLKEAQRMHPVGYAFMNRVATEQITLSDGTRIPKGASVAISAHNLEDESIYPGASTYDGFRFYRKRQEPGQEHRHQFVTTSPEQFAFGHGAHACPGRFFAANEIKIFLIHFLLKYDWKFADERTTRPANLTVGLESICDQTVKLLFKSRQPEVDVS